MEEFGLDELEETFLKAYADFIEGEGLELGEMLEAHFINKYKDVLKEAVRDGIARGFTGFCLGIAYEETKILQGLSLKEIAEIKEQNNKNRTVKTFQSFIEREIQ